MGKAQKNINKGITIVFEEIFKTISAVGERGFIKMLVELREDNHLTYQNETAKTIIKIVAKEFQMSVKELLYGTSRIKDKTHALGMITHILVNQYGFTLKDVAFVLNKNNTNLSRYKKDVENYDPHHRLDLERIEKFDSVKHQLLLLNKQNEQKSRSK